MARREVSRLAAPPGAKLEVVGSYRARTSQKKSASRLSIRRRADRRSDTPTES
jgi:hypothetical protein